MNAVTSAYNRALARLPFQRVDIARMLSPIIEDYPPAREHKQKPKKSDLPPILTAGKRRINLKELK